MPSILVIFVAAWVITQGAKYMLELRNHKNVKLRRVVSESGGMPSSHSAVVIAVATFIGLKEGVHSSIFGLAFVFAMVVIYDSMKVRFSNGKQGEAINNIIEKGKLDVSKVRIVKGHTPLEVAVGSTIGFLLGYIAFMIGV
ncbi:MAG: divergent PAP2 family protein [Candidatus Nanogingivalis sp.]|jgi:acid phosphatase family membrane protein YuiD